MTVRLPLPHFPFRVTFCDSAEGSGEEWTAPGDILKGVTLYCRPTPKTLGFLNNCNDHPIGGGGCLGHLPPCVVMHALNACMQQRNKAKEPKRSNAAKATDQTDQEKPKRNPQNQKEKQKGLGANPGLETSQNSHSPLSQDLLYLGHFRAGQVHCYSRMLRLHPLARVHSIC